MPSAASPVPRHGDSLLSPRSDDSPDTSTSFGDRRPTSVPIDDERPAARVTTDVCERRLRTQPGSEHRTTVPPGPDGVRGLSLCSGPLSSAPGIGTLVAMPQDTPT